MKKNLETEKNEEIIKLKEEIIKLKEEIIKKEETISKISSRLYSLELRGIQTSF